MKCPYCNAETRESVCPYCGSEMPKPTVKKAGCPKCGTQNINFRRELMGSRSKSTSVKITKGVRTRSGGSSASYRTVGLCQDCGYAWVAGGSTSSSHKPWWFWLLMIYIWPIWLSIWFWKTDKINLPRKTKGIILGSVWGVLLLIMFISALFSDGDTSESTAEPTPVVNETIVETPDEVSVAETTQGPVNTSEFDIQELSVMNGTGTERLGTYSMCYMMSADCTEETLAKWYAEVKDKGYNWSVIRYSDFAGDENLGVYGGNGIIEKGVRIAEDGSTESTDDEIVYMYDDATGTLIEMTDDEATTSNKCSTETKAYATDAVRIRQQPNTDCEVLGKAQPGDEVTVIDEEGEWSHINYNGIDGYIKSEFLTANAPSQTQESVAVSELVQNVTADIPVVVAPIVPDPAATTSSTGGGEWENTQLRADKVVYKTPTGKKYHYDPECAGPNATPINLSDAEKRFEPCGTCVLQ